MTQNEITTTDISRFGHREREMASELLKAYNHNNMTERAVEFFYNDDVTVMFNTHSGNVFLTNEDYQVLMFNPDENDKLDFFITLSYNGDEGFFSELKEQYEDLHREDKVQLEQYDLNGELDNE